MTLPHRYIGCDISKPWLDLHDPAGGDRRLANGADGVRQIAETLAGTGAVVVFEATGAYERVLRSGLHAAGIACVRVNPTRARRFAQAFGQQAKTDPLDARMLAEMGRCLALEPEPPPAAERERLTALAVRRDQLVAMRAEEKTRLADAHDRVIRDDLRDAVARLSAAIARIEAEIKACIRDSEDLCRDADLVATAPGVGPVTASVLLGLMPELGRIGPKQAAALAGLAPFDHQSGAFRGQKRIAGGRRRVRRALYMAALAAARRCPDLRVFAERVTRATTSRKAALLAVARKLLIRLNAMLRDRRPYRTASDLNDTGRAGGNRPAAATAQSQA